MIVLERESYSLERGVLCPYYLHKIMCHFILVPMCLFLYVFPLCVLCQDRLPVIEPFSPPDLTPECPVRTPPVGRYTHAH